MWLELAKKREKTHTLEILPIYKKRIAHLIDQKNKPSYHEASVMIVHIGKLLSSIGEDSNFKDYVAELKLEHKPKRNFIEELSKKKL